MDDTMLDGNAVAGLLQEVFATETTSAMVSCDGCASASPMGRPTSTAAPDSSCAAHTVRPH
jgi:hypothetical protein